MIATRGDWRNWAGNQRCRPAAISSPATTEELAAAVERAAGQGLRVKAVGAGHSFTAIATTDGVQLRPDRLTGLVSADPATGLATFRAGTRLRDVPALLAPYGLAMENLGDIDVQTIAGAIATGTHGTGAGFGGLAAQVEGLTLVQADGSVVCCSASERPDLFAAARVGLGAFGVLATVTLSCPPAFVLQADESPMPLAEVLERFDELADGNDHFEFYWFPHTDVALTKRNNRLPADAPAAPLPAWKSYLDDVVLSNGLFELTNRLGHRAPATVPTLNRVAARALGARRYRDASHRVFVTPRRVRFREMEYAVPRASAVGVLREIRALIERRGWHVSFPIEVRVAAADDIWLSTAYRRETAYIAVHEYHRVPGEGYFHGVEDIASAVDGRPHWGKLHFLDAPALAARYPRFDEAAALRGRLDPERRFSNPYLDTVFGSQAAHSARR
jgi:L-gulonolactone oxidase